VIVKAEAWGVKAEAWGLETGSALVHVYDSLISIFFFFFYVI
jgi:hypothetical protein